MTGRERGWLTVRCHYGPEWTTYKKYWCRGAHWRSCQNLLETTGSEQEVRGDRLSIRDDRENHSIIVTMHGLRQDDSDTYWCGVNKPGSDRGTPIRVTVVPGKDLLCGPPPPHWKREGLTPCFPGREGERPSS